jgi:hypothetical protein
MPERASKETNNKSLHPQETPMNEEQQQVETPAPLNMSAASVVGLQRVVGSANVQHLIAQGRLSNLQTHPHNGLPPVRGLVQAKPKEDETQEDEKEQAEDHSLSLMEAGAPPTENPNKNVIQRAPDDRGGGGSPPSGGGGAGSGGGAPPAPSGGGGAGGGGGGAAAPSHPASTAPSGGGGAGGGGNGASGGGGGGAASPSHPASATPTGGAAGGGETPSDGIEMPEGPETLSEDAQKRLKDSQEKTAETADAESELPGSTEQVTEARGAVSEPNAEIDAKAQGRLVAALGSQPGPSPEIEQLCDRIRQAIRDKRPPDEDSLVEADPEQAAREAGSQVNSAVEGDTKRVEGSYDSMTEDEPKGEPSKTATPIPPTPTPESAPTIGAENAAPDPVPAEDVSLDKDVESSEKKMDDAGMNTEPAQLVESGPIAEAREAKGELDKTAIEDPQKVLARQQTAIGEAKTDMAALQAQALDALEQARSTTVTNVETKKSGMVQSEEQMREQVGSQANQIFNTAKTQVDNLLKDLPQKAMTRWDTGVAQLSTQFKQRLAKVKSWIDERHEGVGGAIVELGDELFGLPDWITDEYDAAEREFGDGVCTLLREISTEVNGVIATCQALIQKARDDISQLFSQLPAELQDWAAQERARFDEQLNGLSQKANETRDNFNKELRQRASQAVQEVRQEIHGLREKAKGLVGRIASAIDAFLEDPAKFIIDGLLELVGIPPASFWALVNKISSVIDQIADDPMGFANNLVEALKQGFQKFFDNVGTHLLNGLLQWLFSALGDLGVTVPTDFSLKGIITFFLQLLGISWARIRKLIAKQIGEENVALIEKAWNMISDLIAQGPEGIFEMLKDQLNPQAILDMILQTAIDYLVETLIKQVAIRIIGMLNPAGAIVQAIEVIYKVLKWIFENAARIFSLVETVVNGIADILAGNLGGMAAAIEQALARVLPIVIAFLADLLGLGDLPKKVADAVKKIQSFVEGILDKVITFLAEKAKSLFKALGFGKDDAKEDEKGQAEDEILQDPEKRKQFEAGQAALFAEEPQHVNEDNELDKKGAQTAASTVKSQHPIFASLSVVEGGDTWDYEYTLQRAKFDGKVEKVDPKAKIARASSRLREALELTKSTQLGKNLAHADFTIAYEDIVEEGTIYGVSGGTGDVTTGMEEAIEEDLGDEEGTSVAPLDEDNPFATEGHAFPIPGVGFGWSPGNIEDAEAKILAQLKGVLEEDELPEGTKVTVKLYTEQIPCARCSSSLQKFKEWAEDEKNFKLKMTVYYSFKDVEARKKHYKKKKKK